ncbi:MAG: tRNA (adenosine(37)-N6)-threonylcarbamoyltransferase complex dimerization subunit type 1 TsaB [Candidatus Omnitrophica bacterium]|nr:tRNA (adenosine(37)-N6)-threonylcarbamoyltransferase complex dimerization subunit type 1 TsaB [Candidatus Omnitrophota bacterium]
MKILGIDTATKFLSLGICDGLKEYEYNIDLGTKHSAILVPAIGRVLDALGWDIDDIDYFACGLGPGSFTGIRVGVSTMKALSWSLKKPVIGISTLDIVAGNLNLADASLAVVSDARRGLVYSAIYKIKNTGLRRASPYMLSSVEEFCRKIKNNTVIVGDALGLYKEKIMLNTKSTVIPDKDYWYPKGHSIIKLARQRLEARELNNAFGIEPIYLYPKECQIRKIAGQK